MRLSKSDIPPCGAGDILGEEVGGEEGRDLVAEFGVDRLCVEPGRTGTHKADPPFGDLFVFIVEIVCLIVGEQGGFSGLSRRRLASPLAERYVAVACTVPALVVLGGLFLYSKVS